MKNLKLIVALFMSVFALNGHAQTNTLCDNMQPICTDSVLVFPLNFVANGTPPQAAVGPNYDCVAPQPNPSWFYFEASSSGDINMELLCNVDIDYVIWGPFTDLADATSNCATLGVAPNPPPVDCNALGGINNNFPTITGATVGDVYVMMVTNFSNQNNTFELTQISGTGGTDCSIVVPPCTSTPGTFSLTKNGMPTTTLPISLCAGESFGIFSNGDYTLPEDTITAVDGGDSIYSAQLMFLLYTGQPNGGNPMADSNYTGVIIPSDTIVDTNLVSLSFILDSLDINCDTIYFVPVAGDDGIGGNNNMIGMNDNGQINYDLDSNGCYVLGTAIPVIYNCPLIIVDNILCTPTDNTVSINVISGAGDITAVDLGDGFLSANVVQAPDVISLFNLVHEDTFFIVFTDQANCIDTVEGEFLIPQFVNVDLFAASDCNTAGQVAVEGDPLSGNGGLTSITMNGIVETNTIPVDTISADAGTAVTIVLTDLVGCTNDTTVTVPNALTSLVTVTTGDTVSCHDGADGTATVSATVITVATGQPSGTPIIRYTWISPTGATSGGTATDDTLTGMIHGTWFVEIEDLNGCVTTVPVEIVNPPPLSILITPGGNPNCNGDNNGSVSFTIDGGTSPYASSVTDITGLPEFLPNPSSTQANLLFAGSYFITVTDAKGCSNTESKTLFDPAPINANFTVLDVNCYGDNTGVIIIDTVLTGFEPYSYIWTTPNVTPVPSTSTTIAENLIAGTGYSVTITDVNGCDSTFTFTITEQDSIGSTLESFPAYCRTNSFQSGNGVLTVTSTGGAPGNPTFLWEELSTGLTQNTTTWAGRNPGLYSVTITDNFGCTRVDTILVDSLNPQAIIGVNSTSFDNSGNFQGTEPVRVTFTNNSIHTSDSLDPNSTGTYSWNLFENAEDGGFWFATTDLDLRPDTTYEGEMVYNACLVASNFNGCVDTTCVEIRSFAEPRLIVPNVFTPGSVPNNEFFFPSDGIQTFSATVWNRYGIPVYEFNAITDKWDGTNFKNGNPCADGVYFFTYTAEATNGDPFSGEGNVTLIRKK